MEPFTRKCGAGNNTQAVLIQSLMFSTHCVFCHGYGKEKIIPLIFSVHVQFRLELSYYSS